MLHKQKQGENRKAVSRLVENKEFNTIFEVISKKKSSRKVDKPDAEDGDLKKEKQKAKRKKKKEKEFEKEKELDSAGGGIMANFLTRIGIQKDTYDKQTSKD